MSRLRNFNIRLLSLFLALMVLFCCFNFRAINAEGEIEYSNTLNEWYVQVVWNNNSPDYSLSSSNDEMLYPKLTVKYYINQCRQRYNPGDVKILVPGIGAVKRGSIIQAETTTTHSDTEWNMEYNSEKDIYYFTNKYTIDIGQTKSGGFEMMWELKSRDGENGYTMSNSPEFSLNLIDGETESIILPKLNFEYHSERDKYNINLKRSTINSAEFESISGGVNDKIWYKYETDFGHTIHARGIYRSDYFVKVSIFDDPDKTQETDIDYSQIEVVKSDGTRTNLRKITDPDTNKEVWGFYELKDVTLLSKDTFYLGMPKKIDNVETNLDGKTILVETSFIALYNDETEYVIQHKTDVGEITDEKLTDEDDGTINSYDFVYNGYGYWQNKSNDYANVTSYVNRLLSNSIYNSKVIEYSLEASISRDYSGPASSYSLRSAAMPSAISNEENGTDNDAELGQYTPFQFIQGDDIVSVQLNSGAMRRLENNEYDFEYVTIPQESTVHKYTVYTSDDYNKPFEEYTKFATGDTRKRTTIKFDGNVKAMYVAMEDIVGSYRQKIYVGVNFHLDWESELKKPESQRVNSEGKIANFSFFRMVYDQNGKSVNYAAQDIDVYHGSYALQIAANDKKYYDEYLYRWSSDVPLRTTVTDIESYTSSKTQSEIITVDKDYGGGFAFSTTTRGTIKADEQGELKKFSIYAVMENDDMQVSDDLNDFVYASDKKLDGIELNCSGTTIDGNSITDFSDYVSYEVRKTSDGKTVVVANFDFSKAPLDISKMTSVSMTFPVKIGLNDFEESSNHSYNVTSYTVIHDKGLSKITGNHINTDVRDIDSDEDKTEKVAYSNGTNNIRTPLREWEDSAEKYVKTYLTDDYVYSSNSKNVKAYAWDGKSDSNKYKYSYRLDFNTGETISDVVLYDNIERDTKYEATEDGSSSTGITSKWYGNLLNVDTTFIQSLGITPKVYYSESLHNVDSHTGLEDYKNTNIWKEMTQNGTLWTAPNDAKVQSLAIHLDISKMDGGVINYKFLYAIVNMRTPQKNQDNLGNKTYNAYSIYYKAVYAGGIFDHRLRSTFTEILLDEEKPVLILKKSDIETGNPISGAKFTIYQSDDGKTYTPVEGLENLEVGRTGKLVIKDKLKYEVQYYYKETTSPLGYAVDSTYYPFKFAKGENEKTIKVENTPLTGTLYFTKKDANHSEYSNNETENITSLVGAEYYLYKSDGTRIFVSQDTTQYGKNIYKYDDSGTVSLLVTGTNGFKIENLPWGSYYLKEITAPNGYELNGDKVSFSVQKNLAKENANEIKIEKSQKDNEKTASIRLLKYDSQNATNLKGARFNLERLNTEGEWQVVNRNLTSNVMGEIMVSNLKFGTYRFVETNAPVGYELNETPSKSVVLNADTVGKTLELTMVNDRKTGSATITKYSDDSKTPLAGAKYDLYMVGKDDDTLIKRGLITGANGMTSVVSGLEWGKYYFVETSAPKGYTKSTEKIPFEITAQDVDIRKDMGQTDTKILGSVKLTKIAGDKVDNHDVGDKLSGVKFALYTKSGELVKATKNSDNTYSYDTKGTVTSFETGVDGTITIDKLPWDSYYFEETQALSGFALADKVRFTVNANNCNTLQELECENKKVQCSITIDKEIDTSVKDFGVPTFLFKITKTDGQTSYIKALTIKNGNTGSLTLTVDPGEYKIEELKVSRYELTEVKIIPDGTTADTYSVTDNSYATVTLGTKSDGTPDKVEVKFNNKLYRYDKSSHTGSATNIVAANRKITGISAEYTAGEIPLNKTDADSVYTMEKSNIRFTIQYDDGSEEEITSTDERYNSFVVDDLTVTNGINYAGQIFTKSVTYTDSATSKTYRNQFNVEVQQAKIVENIKVIFKVDEENICYFSVNNRRATANVVYYNEDDDGNKIAVSGEYVNPIVVDENYIFTSWKDKDGNNYGGTETSIQNLLENTTETEITLYAVVSPFMISDYVKDFGFTGDVQEFIAPVSGYYKLETWGAYGGGNSTYAGAGSYVKGTVYLEKGTKLYIYVGEHPTGTQGGWNGGGATYDGTSTYREYPGGGATDIALQNAAWDSAEHLYSRLIVAGAGGGMCDQLYNLKGGNGGSDDTSWAGTNGAGCDYGGGATLSSGGTTAPNTQGAVSYKVNGSFGIGGSSWWINEKIGAGGGGWYGGGAGGGRDYNGSGAGGSSYAWSTEQPQNVEKPLNEYYPQSEYKPDTKYYISNVSASVRDNFDETEGNGHARITYLSAVDYSYSGKLQTFIAPISGYYKLETWGASGGNGICNNNTGEGGKGGYSYGTVYLQQGEIIHIAVGGCGKDNISSFYQSTDGGYNGGGNSKANLDTVWGSGGGATSITTESGLLNSFENNKSAVLLVAGGGGGGGCHKGGGNCTNGGYGGGEIGGNSDRIKGITTTGCGNGGTQESGGTANASEYNGSISSGSFGQGGNAQSSDVNGQHSGGSGGGGGWYGGSSGYDYGFGGGGGSGHVGKTLISGDTIGGNNKFLAPDGTVETGHSGNGYARVTYVNPLSTSSDFRYTGTVQTFTAKQSGTYKLETWGAQGGGSVASKTNKYPNEGLFDPSIVPVEGGRGGYTTADVYLNSGQTIYVTVGGKGMEVYGTSGTTNIIAGGFNGGGATPTYTGGNIYNGGGGGATHIALTQQGDGQLANYKSNQDDVLVVAGGGGGSGYYQNTSQTQYSHHGLGGAGGGLESEGNHNNSSISHGVSTVEGSTQTDSGNGTGRWAKGSFGQGATYTAECGTGGGGGWYGGSSTELQGGAGGSGHIAERLIGESIIGTEDFLAPDGTVETGHNGDGYARITYIK